MQKVGAFTGGINGLEVVGTFTTAHKAKAQDELTFVHGSEVGFVQNKGNQDYENGSGRGQEIVTGARSHTQGKSAKYKRHILGVFEHGTEPDDRKRAH